MRPLYDVRVKLGRLHVDLKHLLEQKFIFVLELLVLLFVMDNLFAIFVLKVRQSERGSAIDLRFDSLEPSAVEVEIFCLNFVGTNFIC